MILFLYGRIRANENPYSRIFYAVSAAIALFSVKFSEKFKQHCEVIHFLILFPLRTKDVCIDN